MNKQELIEKIESLPSLTSITSIRPYVDKKIVLGLISQLDEPEIVKVSEEEAKFLETFNLNHRSDVTKALYYISRVGFGYCLTNNDDLELRGLSEEFWDFENRKRLIKAILDGYEVEKEKRYLVKIKGIDTNFNSLNRHRNENYWIFSSEDKNTLYQTHHTRKELEEADFGWVFDCEGIEVEEVEE